jgi:hypothetical protein
MSKASDLLMSNDQLRSFSEWGAYPIFYVNSHNDVICPKCANEECISYIGNDTIAVDEDLVGEVNWEDPTLYCDFCGADIPSAYADDGDEPEEDTDDDDVIRQWGSEYGDADLELIVMAV